MWHPDRTQVSKSILADGIDIVRGYLANSTTPLINSSTLIN